MTHEQLQQIRSALLNIKSYGDVYQYKAHEVNPYVQLLEVIDIIDAALAAPVSAPQREWQGLTAEQVNDVRRRFATNISVPYFVMIYTAIEAVLKEKNHG